ncbi:MAG TPA: glycosyltransferase [Mycobacteriales bacterium]|jgi:glycosyltransferase involved in cell wall biosynthesis
MRVAHFTDTYLPRRDGVVTSVQTLDRQLRLAGHDSFLVVPRHPGVVAEAGQRLLTLRSVPCGVAGLRLAPWPRQRHVDRVADRAPDVVHVHTPGPAGLLGVLTARRLGLPLVHTYHTDLAAYVDAYRIPTRVLRVAVGACRRRLGEDPAPAGAARDAVLAEGLRLLVGGADAVVVPTPAVLDRTSLPVAADRVRVIPTGVGPAVVTTGAVEDFRRRYRIAAGDRVVLAVGRVHAEKGTGLLLESFARVRAAEPRARLVLVGPVFDPVAGPRVVCTGQLPPEQVAAAYAVTQRTGGVLAFPSQTDTQGLVLQEAAHAGVPAVMTDADLCARGPLDGAALVARPTADGFAAAVTALLGNAVLARSLADRARRAAVAHTPAAYADAMLGLYQEVSRRPVGAAA